ncbi:hypothetical protein Ddye_022579 [Dipteronia dyeriana]|uniref:Uncharacterized protein n=1 Tax=Dipteronia dyeriana TaxID=168575 RepID=A0AAD9WRK5_9ROSI|nr:hypothetical protein Ddye_022579 [Dipteronia dyeriana]
MKYLTPLEFYTKIFKDILMNKDSKHSRLLGLDVYEDYVSLAVSDPNNLIAVPLRNLDYEEDNISSRVADIILSLIPEYNLMGIVVGADYFRMLNRPFMKYLMPLDFYTQIFKDILMNKDSKHGRLLAVPLRNLDNEEDNISSRVADIILSLIPANNLVRIVIGAAYGLPHNRPFLSVLIDRVDLAFDHFSYGVLLI